MQDIMALKALGDNKENSNFENYLISHKESKRASGTAIAGLVLGTVGTAVGVGAWIFGPVLSNSRANGLRDLANARYDATRDTLNQIANLLAAERSERIAGDVTLTNTVNDSVSGSQQGTLTAQQAAELSSMQSVQNTLFTQAVLGNLSENAQKVQLYSAPQPCGCPGSCGCNN